MPAARTRADGRESRWPRKDNHDLRPHWKLVTDSSLNGNDTFELVSPILEGEDGLEKLERVCCAGLL